MKNVIFVLSTISMLFLSCSKDKNTSNNQNNSNDPVTNVTDEGEFKVTKFYLGGLSFFSPDFYLDEFNASERKNISSSQYFLNEPVKQYALLRSNTNGTYGLRYIGDHKIIDPVKVFKVSGEIAMYALNDSLLGKPIFEVYELATNKVYQRYTASADSCVIEIYRGAWASGTIDTSAFRNAYNSLIDTGIAKQHYRIM